MRVRAGHGAHRVEEHAVPRGEVGAQAFEVEQLLHHGRVVFERVDDDDFSLADAHAPVAFEVYVRVVEREVARDVLRLGVDALGDGLGRGAAVARVVLDAEIFFEAAGVVAGREDETAEGPSAADDGRDGGRREDAAAPDEQRAEAVGRGHADDGLGGLAIVEAPVATDDERLLAEAAARVGAHGVEDRLHEVLKVAGLHEDACLLAQPRSARALPLEGTRPDGLHALSHRSQGWHPLFIVENRCVDSVFPSHPGGKTFMAPRPAPLPSGSNPCNSNSRYQLAFARMGMEPRPSTRNSVRVRDEVRGSTSPVGRFPQFFLENWRKEAFFRDARRWCVIYVLTQAF